MRGGPRLLLDLTMIVAGALRAFATLTADVVLKQRMSFSRSSLVIDPLMLQIAATHPELYARYKAARVIVDIGTGDGGAPPVTPPVNP